jgi:synaptobrevin homolog YKT6
MRVQQEVEDTKVVLQNSIESILERAEMMDTPVERSDEPLTVQSEVFYKAKNQV